MCKDENKFKSVCLFSKTIFTQIFVYLLCIKKHQFGNNTLEKAKLEISKLNQQINERFDLLQKNDLFRQNVIEWFL